MKIAVLGTGYVGLVTGACFAETGNHVVCIDTNAEKIELLKKGEIPFYEPGLHEIVFTNMQEGRLSFSSNTIESLKGAEIAFVCVGTPSKEDGSADLKYVFEVAETVATKSDVEIIAIKSTVPVGTCEEVRKRLGPKTTRAITIVSNPEFLREGSAVSDCLVPDRVVVGTNDLKVAETFEILYAPFVRTGRPIFIMDVRSSEMTKYAANAFLAQRISFMNEMSMLCEVVGADIALVRKGLASDHRIGNQYLFPSVGFGGSCFPKDVRALIALSESKGVSPSMLLSTLEINETQKKRFTEKVIQHFGGASNCNGKKIAVWGLAFKAKTDDIRESPALAVIDALLKVGFVLSVYDPVAMKNVQRLYGERVTYGTGAYETLDQASALLILTEWNQFRIPDFEQMKKRLESPTIFDGRNLYEPAVMAAQGFTYYSIGRAKISADTSATR